MLKSYLKRGLAVSACMLACVTVCTPPIYAATKTLDAIFGDATELPAYEVLMSAINIEGRDSWPSKTNFVTWKRVPGSDTRLILCGFLGDTTQEYEFQLVASKNDNARESATGMYLRYDTNKNPTYGKGMLGPNLSLMTNGQYRYICTSKDRYIVYKVVKADDGTYAFTNRNAVASTIGKETQSNGYIVPLSSYTYQNPYYVFAPVNCDVSYYVKEVGLNPFTGNVIWNSPVFQTTGGYYEIDEKNGTFKMMNIADIGGSMYLESNDNYVGYFHGTVDPETKRFKFEEENEKPAFVQTYATRGSQYDRQYNMRAMDPDAGLTYSNFLEGSYSLGNPAHNDAPNGWVTNGGSRKTYQGGYMKFDYPLTFSYNDMIMYQLNFYNCYSDMTFGNQEDVTLDADLEITEYKVSNDNDAMYIKGVVNLRNNTHLLHDDGGIDIMIVDGEVTDINNHTPHHELGLEGASEFITKLSKSAAQSSRERIISGDGIVSIPFSKYVTKSEDPSISTDRRLSLFIRGRYNDEHNLTHTFHSLQTPAMEVTTGIDTPEIDMTSMQVEFFDLQGRSYGNEVPGEPGVYIRRAGNEAKKIVVNAR